MFVVSNEIILLIQVTIVTSVALGAFLAVFFHATTRFYRRETDRNIENYNSRVLSMIMEWRRERREDRREFIALLKESHRETRAILRDLGVIISRVDEKTDRYPGS